MVVETLRTKSIYLASILLVRAQWTAHSTKVSNGANTPKVLLYIDLSKLDRSLSYTDRGSAAEAKLISLVELRIGL